MIEKGRQNREHAHQLLSGPQSGARDDFCRSVFHTEQIMELTGGFVNFLG
jgi:hypothetical protein